MCIIKGVYEVVPLALVQKKKKNSEFMGFCELPPRDGICCLELGIHKCKQNSVYCRMCGCMYCITK